MEVSRQLSINRTWKAPYAVILKTTNEILTLDNPYPARPEETDEVALKDVEYAIVDGVLYMSGTRIFHYHLWDILKSVENYYGSRLLFTINHKKNDKLVNPFAETD